MMEGTVAVGVDVRVAVSASVGASVTSVASGVPDSIGASVNVTSGRRRVQALANKAMMSKPIPARTRNGDSSTLISNLFQV